MHRQPPESHNNHKHTHLSCRHIRKKTHNHKDTHRTEHRLSRSGRTLLLGSQWTGASPSLHVCSDGHTHTHIIDQLPASAPGSQGNGISIYQFKSIKEIDDTWYSMSFSACSLSSSLDCLKNLKTRKKRASEHCADTFGKLGPA
jgi:hypothetical protein